MYHCTIYILDARLRLFTRYHVHTIHIACCQRLFACYPEIHRYTRMPAASMPFDINMWLTQHQRCGAITWCDVIHDTRQYNDDSDAQEPFYPSNPMQKYFIIYFIHMHLYILLVLHVPPMSFVHPFVPLYT